MIQKLFDMLMQQKEKIFTAEIKFLIILACAFKMLNADIFIRTISVDKSINNILEIILIIIAIKTIVIFIFLLIALLNYYQLKVFNDDKNVMYKAYSKFIYLVHKSLRSMKLTITSILLVFLYNDNIIIKYKEVVNNLGAVQYLVYATLLIGFCLIIVDIKKEYFQEV